MPDDTFRIVITVAVALAALAFVVQAAVMVALYSAARKMQRKAEPLMGRAETLIAEAGPALGKLQEAIGKIQETVQKAGPAIEKIGPVLDRAVPVIERTGPLLDRAGKFLETSQEMLEDARPKVKEFTSEAVEIAKSGRKQVEGVGEFLQEAGDRARLRLEQIDQSVDGAVEHVEQVGDAMKRAVLRPVREVNGIGAGIAAVLSTLIRGRKYSVDHATQDEEMFI